MYHRDIRRPNILRRRDNDKRFLIDWSDASTTPTGAAPHLSKEGHSPRVHEDNHGAEVDIWGIGYHLKELASRSRPADAYGLEQIGKRWIEDYIITAEAALDKIKVRNHYPFVIVY